MKKIKNLIQVSIALIFITACTNSKESRHTTYVKEIDSLKNSNQELLIKINELKTQKQTPKTTGEKFDYFIYKFMTDSLFQKSRIQFPLTSIHWKNNYPGEVIDTTYIIEENWRHDWLYFTGYSEIPQLYDNYEMKLRPTGKRMLHFTGVETGTDAKYYFKQKNNKWHLIKLENLGS